MLINKISIAELTKYKSVSLTLPVNFQEITTKAQINGYWINMD